MEIAFLPPAAGFFAELLAAPFDDFADFDAFVDVLPCASACTVASP